MTINFWHNLQIYLIERDLYLAFGDETAIEAEKNRRLLKFRSSYESVVSLTSFRVQYPDDYMELSREDLRDFKRTRYAIAALLVDAALVLGSDTVLKILYMKLSQCISKSTVAAKDINRVREFWCRNFVGGMYIL